MKRNAVPNTITICFTAHVYSSISVVNIVHLFAALRKVSERAFGAASSPGKASWFFKTLCALRFRDSVASTG